VIEQQSNEQSPTSSSGRPADDNYEIRVDDHGPGIPAEQVAIIFERGQRSPTSPGLGLGLAIARDIVDDHGGHLSVERSGPPGATFLVTFPIPTTRVPPDANANRSP
jgi:signal transduction histidine kinase